MYKLYGIHLLCKSYSMEYAVVGAKDAQDVVELIKKSGSINFGEAPPIDEIEKSQFGFTETRGVLDTAGYIE